MQNKYSVQTKWIIGVVAVVVVGAAVVFGSSQLQQGAISRLFVRRAPYGSVSRQLPTDTSAYIRPAGGGFAINPNPAPPLPDLKITNMFDGTSTFSVFNVYLSNAGTVRTQQSLNLQVDVYTLVGGNAPRRTYYPNNIPCCGVLPGGTSQVDVSIGDYLAKEGINKIVATVDYKNIEQESNENNNTFTKTFQAPPPPPLQPVPAPPLSDFTVSNLVVSDAHPPQISFDIANITNGIPLVQSKTKVETYTFANGNVPKSTDVVGVASQYVGSSTVSIFPAGINSKDEISKVVITADYENVVPEANENNNVLNVTVNGGQLQHQPLPDLKPLGVNLRPVDGSSTVYVDASIQNAGPGTSTGYFRTDISFLDVNKNVVKTYPQIGLTLNVPWVLSANGTTTTWQYDVSTTRNELQNVAFMQVTVDSLNDIKESDENNNIETYPIVPPPL